MITNQAISTISYNTETYLTNVLKTLENNGIIDEWYFIKHKGETDFYTGEREKDHAHVYIMPCKKLDTDALRQHFIEIEPNNEKPLGVMPFRKSKLDDWVMYGVHDVNYLRTMGEEKEYTYSWKEIKGFDDEAIKRAVKHASAKAYRELRKRETVASVGVLASYNMGIIKTQELLGLIAVEKYRSEYNQKLQIQQEIMKSKFLSGGEDVPFKEDNNGI